MSYILGQGTKAYYEEIAAEGDHFPLDKPLDHIDYMRMDPKTGECTIVRTEYLTALHEQEFEDE